MSDDSKTAMKLIGKYWHKLTVVALVVIGLWRGIPIANQARESVTTLWTISGVLDSLNHRAFRAESTAHVLAVRFDSLEVRRTGSTVAIRAEVAATPEAPAPVYKPLPKMLLQLPKSIAAPRSLKQ